MYHLLHEDRIRQPSLAWVQNDYPLKYKTRRSVKGNRPSTHRRKIDLRRPQKNLTVLITPARFAKERSRLTIKQKRLLKLAHHKYGETPKTITTLMCQSYRLLSTEVWIRGQGITTMTFWPKDKWKYTADRTGTAATIAVYNRWKKSATIQLERLLHYTRWLRDNARKEKRKGLVIKRSPQHSRQKIMQIEQNAH